MKNIEPEYECCECHRKWIETLPRPTQCDCGSLYVKWTNYGKEKEEKSK